MSPWLIGVVTALYVWTCVDLWLVGQRGHSIMFFGYAVANVGVIMAVMRDGA